MLTDTDGQFSVLGPDSPGSRKEIGGFGIFLQIILPIGERLKKRTSMTRSDNEPRVRHFRIFSSVNKTGQISKSTWITATVTSPKADATIYVIDLEFGKFRMANTRKGHPKLLSEGFGYTLAKNGKRELWRCDTYFKQCCARIHIIGGKLVPNNREHNHPPNENKY